MSSAPTPVVRHGWEVALVAVAAVWGFTFTTVKEAVAHVPVFEFLALRFGLAAVLMTAVAWPRLRGLARSGWKAAAVGGAMIFTGYGCRTVAPVHHCDERGLHLGCELTAGHVPMSPAMPDESALVTLRAAIEAIAPAVDGQPGALELGVEDHVVHQIEMYLPGFTEMLAALLDAYAMDVRPGAAFAELTPDERGEVFRLMAGEESQDIREAVDAMFVFTFGGVYSESAAPAGERPAAWDRVGFAGPSFGHPDYRKDS